MKLFQWAFTTTRDAVLSPIQILRQAWQRVKSGSSLQRENLELRYQVELLRVKNKKLTEAMEGLKDENILLWEHMDEMKEAEKAIMKSITDEIEESMLRNLTPVGDA